MEFSEIIKKIYGLKKAKKVYRGMRLKSTRIYGTSWQNSLGLSEKELGRRLKTGEEVAVQIKTPLSWTLHEDIAMAFGDTVVTCTLPASQPYLFISKELSYLVCKRRNVRPVSQEEIVTFPPFNTTLTTVSVRS